MMQILAKGLICSALTFGLALQALSQIVPDATLPTNSTAVQGCTSCTISGGTIRGSNLFHSFRDFNIVTGGEAFFNNALTIQNIFTRVTGSKSSTIDGSIRANGSANFWLLNSHGISFGPNARLELGGSFLATTANRLRFADGGEFVTTPTTRDTLLTNSVPIGLGFLNPGAIEVVGTGHQQLITSVGNTFSAALLLSGQGQGQGLRVQPERTLALLGGSVSLQGGLATAPSGRIEVGSVESGTVNFIPSPGGFGINYAGSNGFGPITLVKQAALDATGSRFSNIRLKGKTVTLNDASLLTISNTGDGAVGAIQVDATEQINLQGLTPFNRQDLLPFVQKIKRSIVSDTTAGKGADVLLNAPEIRLDQSAYVTSLTFGTGQGGDVVVNGGRLVDIRNFAPSESAAIGSSISTETYGTGQSGTIRVAAPTLNVVDSGVISSLSYSNAKAGNTYISTDSTRLSGGTPKLVVSLRAPSAILTFAATFIGSEAIGTGSSGDVFLDAKNLQVTDGAQLATVAFGSGKAGSLTVNATNVLVEGSRQLTPADLQRQFQITPGFVGLLAALKLLDKPIPLDAPSRSVVGSGAGFNNVFSATVLNTLGVTPVTKAGSVTINADRLQIDRTGLVTVQNTAIGDAGTALIRANRVQLTNGGEISALTANGNGGNIEINSRLLSLKQGSITASASGRGNGGNISIFSDVVGTVRSPNRITANSDNAFGGRILIVSKGVFLSPGTIVTATSARGPELSGIVLIQTPDIDLSRSAVQAVPEPTIPDVAVRCGGSSSSNSFTITGTGGIPVNPDDFFTADEGWHDQKAPRSQIAGETTEGAQLVEAQGWERTAANTVRFVVTGKGLTDHADTPAGCVKAAQVGTPVGGQP